MDMEGVWSDVGGGGRSKYSSPLVMRRRSPNVAKKTETLVLEAAEVLAQWERRARETSLRR